MAALENLSEDEAYLFSILSDPSGLDLAEFCWFAPGDEETDGCWRARPYQWSWFRCTDPMQIDQCVAEGQLVLTRDGWIPIEDVAVGQEVLTHKNRWRPVTYKWDRGVHPVVTVRGHGNQNGVKVTSDHKFYGKSVEGEVGWVSSAELDRWSSPACIEGATTVPQMEPAYRSGRQNYVRDTEDIDWLWLYGLYLAEGSTFFGKNCLTKRVVWSIHEDELAEVSSRLVKVGLNFSVEKIKNEKCVNVRVNSAPCAAWVSEHGRNLARNKEIASWVYGLSAIQRQAVLDGAIYGDGYSRVEGRSEYASTSRKLCLGIKLLAQSLGYSASVRHGRKAQSCEIQGRTVERRDSWCVDIQRLDGQRAPRARIEDGSVWSKISSVQSDGVSRVYDLEVQDDHSFVVESLIVSNCARSVGKSLSIKLRGFAFPFLWPGQEMVVTAPELNHLEPIVQLIEEQFYATRLGREMMIKGRGGVTHRPFLMKFSNQARILGKIPQKDGKGVKGTHPLWLELDEAQDYPHGGWVELTETLKRGQKGAVWRAHGVTRGVQDDFYKRSADPNTQWTVHRITAMHRPDWTNEEREEKEAEYGSRDDPDYRRNILGEHGDATNPIFVLSRLMKVVDDNPESQFNTEEYTKTKITAEILSDFNGDIERILYEDIPEPPKKYKAYWGGMDVGYTNDPSEILIFGEHTLSAEEVKARKTTLKKYPDAGLTALTIVARISLIRIRASDQVKVVTWCFKHFPNMRKFSMDATGNGLSLFQDMQDASVGYVDKINGYKFGSRILVDFDDRVEVDEMIGDVVEEAGINAIVEIYATDLLRKLVDTGRIWIPFDDSMLASFQGQTAIVKKQMDQYGKKHFSSGNFHVLDAARLAVLGWKQYSIEKMVKERAPESVIDMPLFDDFESGGYGGDDWNDAGW